MTVRAKTNQADYIENFDLRIYTTLMHKANKEEFQM